MKKANCSGDSFLIKVYGLPTCDKIKRTLTLLASENIKFSFVNVRKNPLSKDTLKHIVNQLGIEIVLNKRGMLFRKSGLKEKTLTDQQLFEELFKEQGMIKRPLIEKNGKYISGFDEEAIITFIK